MTGRSQDAVTSRPPSTSWAKVAAFFILLAAAWLLWSGFFKPLLLGLGLLSCALTIALMHRMGHFSGELFAWRYDFKLLGYWAWLAKEIVASSLEVARVVVDPRLPIKPRLVEVSIAELGPVDQVLLGNSVTLTPGSLAIDLHEGRLLVHTLTEEGAKQMLAGEMYRRVSSLRGI